MITRKSLNDKKKEKPVEVFKGRKPDPKWNIDRLEDAVQDGKLMVDVGEEVIVIRPRDGKLQKSLCVVKSIDNGLVATYDETRGQFYSFPLVGLEKYDIVIKKSLNGRSRAVKETLDVSVVNEEANVGSLT